MNGLVFPSPLPSPNGRGRSFRALGAALLLVLLFLSPHVTTCAAVKDLAWQDEPYGRSAALPPQEAGRDGFTLLPSASTSVTFTNLLSRERAAENQIRLNGSGVAAGDVDGDGWCDLYFCGLENGNRLYRNLGNWRFVDVTDSSGAACSNQFSTGAALADIDSDGDLDLLVTGIGAGARAFLNDGSGHFTEAANSGLIRRLGAMSMALGDIDGDGDLDLYVANYRTTTIRSTGFALLNVGGKRMLRPEDRNRLEYTSEGLILEHGEPDFVYRNDGRGHFEPLSWTNGVFLTAAGQALTAPPRDWGLTVAFRDLNGDRAPDIYVANDFHSPDRMWINDGHGRFSPMAPEAIRHTPTFSMAVDFADLNRDGHDDFLSLDMLERGRAARLQNVPMSPPNTPAIGEGLDRPQIDRNTLQLNRGDNTFADIAQFAGLEASGWSWSMLFLDVDLDGYEDVLLGTGSFFNTQDLDANAQIAARGPFPRELIPSKLLMYPPLPQPKLAFHNNGRLQFEERGAAWGFHQAGVAHGMALADLDNDGDLDVMVNNLNAAAGLYRNTTTAPRVAVRLKGAPGNTRGIGARIRVLGGPAPQSQEMTCGSRYLSSDDPMRVFAAGGARELRVEVEWRSGKRTVIEHALPNRMYECDESVAATEPPVIRTSEPAPPSPLFKDVSSRLRHAHHEEPFDDFARQPLLPRNLSQLGPGAAWFDCDGDGWEDLIVGSGNGGQLALFRNDGAGGFEPLQDAPMHHRVTRDQTGLVAWRSPKGQTRILTGAANYEDGLAAGSCVREYDLASRVIRDSLPGQASSTGPLAVTDPGDGGALVLFVGGRVIPGRYPAPASSMLFRLTEEAWRLDQTSTTALAHVGLVSAATWSDLDGDGRPELLLACEWGPLKVFTFQGQTLTETTSAWGLPTHSGLWTSVTTGDFNADGRPDILAGNLGLNTPYQATLSAPIRLYYGDLDANRTIDLLEAEFDSAAREWRPTRDLHSVLAALPSLAERFSTHRAWSEAAIPQIVGAQSNLVRFAEARTLATTLFLNRGRHFEPAPLPQEAQFAPVFGLTVADFNGDGADDVFLAQNFFATEPQVPRHDAGRGLLLLGDGRGQFGPMPGQESGIAVWGEQRGCAAADYDHDGRVDLVVTQDGARTRLFHNRNTRPGLRVRLAGPASNPDAIGASLRVKVGKSNGPAREIHAGSGYWSQDAPVQIFAMPAAPATLEVRWPGGRTTTNSIPDGATEVEVNSTGTIIGR